MIKYDNLTDSQKEFVKKNIVSVFGEMPDNLDDIKIVDVYGYEASYRGLVLRFESDAEMQLRWGPPDPIKVARIALSEDPVARQVIEDLRDSP